MPLPKADWGDYSASDPLTMALRQALDYYLAGEAPADHRGANVSSAERRPLEVQKLPPVRIDLEALAKAPAAVPDPLAMGQPQPPLPPGWTQESGTAGLVEPGARIGPAGELPERGRRPGLPERNPAFHDTGDQAILPENMLTTADILANMPADLPPAGAELSFLENMSPVDRLKIEKQLLERQQLPEEQRAENLQNLGMDALSVVPIIGHGLSAYSGFEQGDKAVSALGAGKPKDAAVSGILAALGAVGAVTGLPTGRIAGRVAQSGKNTLNVFAGPTAKTADHEKLKIAKELEKSGADRDEIWNETGWFKGVDKKWRFEIPDKGARFTPEIEDQFKWFRSPAAYEGPMFGAVEHPQLQAAYTDIAGGPKGYELNQSAILDDLFGRTKGGYWGGKQRIKVEEPTPKSAMSTTLHETQHDIQRREEFARGGSADDFTSRQALQGALERARRNEGYDPVTGDYDFVIEHNLKRAPDDPYEAYQRIAGEVEARNVEKRSQMTPEQLRANPPWKTQDVPDDEQILSGMGYFKPDTEAAFVRVPGDDPMAETARLLYENAPRSYGARSAADPRNRQLAEELGVFYGPEGLLMRELPNEGIAMTGRKFAAGDVAPVKDVMNYPALSRELPEVMETPVKFTTERAGGAGGPIARTTPEGFEITAGEKSKHTRRNMEKLLQYRIGGEQGLSGAFRDSLPSKIEDMQDAISQTRIAMQVGAVSPETGRAYIQAMEDELGMIDTAFALARTKPERIPALAERGFSSGKGVYPTSNDVRSALKNDLHQRGAGNNTARAAMSRLTRRDDAYPLEPGQRFVVPGSGGGATNYIAPLGDQIVLPQKDMDVMDLAVLLENWRRRGAGSGNR